jgi:hypothetical protein
MEQFRKLLGIIAENQDLLALHGVRNALFVQQALRHFRIGNGHKGVELAFVLKVLVEAFSRHDVAGANVQPHHGRLFGCTHVCSFRSSHVGGYRLSAEVVERERLFTARFVRVYRQAELIDPADAPRRVAVTDVHHERGGNSNCDYHSFYPRLTNAGSTALASSRNADMESADTLGPPCVTQSATASEMRWASVCFFNCHFRKLSFS